MALAKEKGGGKALGQRTITEGILEGLAAMGRALMFKVGLLQKLKGGLERCVGNSLESYSLRALTDIQGNLPSYVLTHIRKITINYQGHRTNLNTILRDHFVALCSFLIVIFRTGQDAQV